MKTREEVEALKAEWANDPCWDLEKTEGFEEYHDELFAFTIEQERLWEAKSIELARKARQIYPHANVYPHHCMEDGIMGVDGEKAGISIRAQIAAQIMSGIVNGGGWFPNPEKFAKRAVEYADALINELNK